MPPCQGQSSSYDCRKGCQDFRAPAGGGDRCSSCDHKASRHFDLVRPTSAASSSAALGIHAALQAIVEGSGKENALKSAQPSSSSRLSSSSAKKEAREGFRLKTGESIRGAMEPRLPSESTRRSSQRNAKFGIKNAVLIHESIDYIQSVKYKLPDDVSPTMLAFAEAGLSSPLPSEKVSSSSTRETPTYAINRQWSSWALLNYISTLLPDAWSYFEVSHPVMQQIRIHQTQPRNTPDLVIEDLPFVYGTRAKSVRNIIPVLDHLLTGAECATDLGAVKSSWRDRTIILVPRETIHNWQTAFKQINRKPPLSSSSRSSSSRSSSSSQHSHDSSRPSPVIAPAPPPKTKKRAYKASPEPEAVLISDSESDTDAPPLPPTKRIKRSVPKSSPPASLFDDNDWDSPRKLPPVWNSSFEGDFGI